ncbi:MAG: extracellular solute-binding protein [Ruminococcus sp.]|nr:extracellular solute-binding protein [Ruminococcus sp.]
MKKIGKYIASIMALSMVFSLTACSGGDSSSTNNGDVTTAERTKEEDEVTVADLSDKYANDVDISGQEIVWLAYYDINPSNNDDRSVALTLFEDTYGGKIKWVQTTSATKFDDLANMIISGDQVDMFPYEWDCLPNGVYKNQYEALDDYINLDDELWSGVKDMAESLSYNGQHYVIPYAISDPVCIQYSRTLMDEEGLDDPYELYQKGEWDWDAFMSMMEEFVNNADDGEERFGINGWFGQALVQSTGKTIVTYDGTTFTNNITDPQIEKAELLLQQISQEGLYDQSWKSYFPEDGLTLFYAMGGTWSLGESNGKNPDGDIMIVPFPKDPDADNYYACANFAAKMLVKNSQMGDAVATYIKCERIAQVEEQYKETAKQKALIQTQDSSGNVIKFITEEQYDAFQTYVNNDIVPVFDYGFGMGSRMYGDGDYTYETRGVMNNLMEALLNGEVSTWAELREAWSSVVDTEIENYN